MYHNVVVAESNIDIQFNIESNSHFLLECRIDTQHRQSMVNKLQVLLFIYLEFYVAFKTVQVIS